MRRMWAGLAAAAVAAIAVPGPGAAAETELTYSIREARAYSVKVPLGKEVIEGASQASQCDPAEDPYNCDDTRYNHQPNCPAPVSYGPNGEVPEPKVPGPVEERTGGAGDREGAEEAPPEGSPVALNELLALGSLGKLGDTEEAAGMASQRWVDLSGRQEPEAHVESDAFSGNARRYEERCFPREDVPDAYQHLLSRSERGPQTYSLAECFERGCTFGGAAIGGADEGRTIVHLRDAGDRVVGRLSSVLQRASWGDGALTVDLLQTVVTFESDGTSGGLRWTVASRVVGAELGGRPIELPQGQVVGGPGIQVGLAAPYIEAAEDGGSLRILAAGLFVASGEQSAYFGGGEVEATFGRGTPPPEIDPPPDDTGDDPVTGSGFSTDGFETGPVTTAPTATPPVPTEAPQAGAPVAAPAPVVSVEEFATGRAGVVVILALGGFALLLVLLRWITRFSWGQSLYEMQPFRSLDWIYRAFLKT